MVLRPGRRMSIMIGAIALLAVGMNPMASSQDQSATIAKDAIFARKILMDTINTNMDELETMTTSDKGVNLAEGREHADLISVMLMGFPHLFPASTNQWKPNVERDPGRDTYASPDLFTNYADFYARAAAAAKTAYRASRARRTATSRRMWRSCGWHATHATGSISSLTNSRSALTRRSEMTRDAAKT
jgi:hypothetical protein